MATYGLPIVLLILVSVAILLAMNRRLRREVSRRRQLERELRDSEQHYRGLVESLNAIAWEMRLEENRFTYVSPHAERLLGYPSANGCSRASGSGPCTPWTPSTPSTTA